MYQFMGQQRRRAVLDVVASYEYEATNGHAICGGRQQIGSYELYSTAQTIGDVIERGDLFFVEHSLA